MLGADIPYSLDILREQIFTDFIDLWVTSKILTLKNYVLHYNSLLCFYDLQNVYNINAESHESMKIVTLEIFRLYVASNNSVESGSLPCSLSDNP